MSRLRANQITNENANGAPNFPHGLTVTGIVTATTLNQTPTSIVVGSAVTANSQGIDVTGVVTATSFKGAATNLTSIPAANLTGALPAISGANLTGIAADKIFEGNTEVETVDTGSDGHIIFKTEGTEKARITTAGRYKIPSIDLLCAANYKRLSNNNSNSMHNDDADLKFIDGVYNLANSNVYNTSNGRYTAPVRGLYLFSIRGLLDNDFTSGTAILKIRVNNVDTEIFMFYSTPSSNYKPASGTTIIPLNANDYLTFRGLSRLHTSNETQFSACLLQHY